MCPVSGNQPQLFVVDKRRGNLCIAVSLLYFSGILEKCLIHFPSSRKPVRHPRCSFVKHKEVEFFSELLMISLLCLFQPLQVLLQGILIREDKEIDSL